jgi:hypothetical protein
VCAAGGLFSARQLTVVRGRLSGVREQGSVVGDQGSGNRDLGGAGLGVPIYGADEPSKMRTGWDLRSPTLSTVKLWKGWGTGRLPAFNGQEPGAIRPFQY